MKVFGLEIKRAAPTLRVAGTGFEVRSAKAKTALAVPPRPVNDFVAPTFNNGWGYPAADDLTTRAIKSDPRDAYLLSLPWKLTPQQCLMILRQALGGDLWSQSQLLYLMLDTWPVFRMASHQLREAVSYAKFNVHPYAGEGSEPTKIAKEKAGLVSRAIRGFSPNPFTDEVGFSGMVYHLSDAMLNGVGLVEVLWGKKRTKTGPEILPRAAAWVHPKHFTFTNDGTLTVFGQDMSVLFDSYQVNRRQPETAPTPHPDKFLCAQFLSRSGSCLGAGFMRPLVWYWAARQWGLEWMLTTAKQYGAPFIEVTYKPGMNDQDEINKLEAFLRQSGSNRRLLHPEGTVATVHPATNLGTDNPQRHMAEEADKMALYLLLGQDSTTHAVPGQLGEQETKANVKQERVTALAEWLARNPLRQFARSVLRQNYGNDDECPEVKSDFTQPLSAGEVAQFSSSVSMSGLPVRADEFYKKIGMTQPEPGDLIYQRGEIMPMPSPEERAAQMEAEQEAMSDQAKVEARLKEFSPEARKKLALVVERAESSPVLNGEWDEIKAMLMKR